MKLKTTPKNEENFARGNTKYKTAGGYVWRYE